MVLDTCVARTFIVDGEKLNSRLLALKSANCPGLSTVPMAGLPAFTPKAVRANIATTIDAAAVASSATQEIVVAWLAKLTCQTYRERRQTPAKQQRAAHVALLRPKNAVLTAPRARATRAPARRKPPFSARIGSS